LFLNQLKIEKRISGGFLLKSSLSRISHALSFSKYDFLSLWVISGATKSLKIKNEKMGNQPAYVFQSRTPYRYNILIKNMKIGIYFTRREKIGFFLGIHMPIISRGRYINKQTTIKPAKNKIMLFVVISINSKGILKNDAKPAS
jgi:hypothetical protein